MKFIPTMEISSRIMTLIEEAEKHIIIVSPYVQISQWTKMQRVLRNATERGVNIVFYVRTDVVQDLRFLRDLKIKIVQIDFLHAKVYLNESYGIVSSQNMIFFSDANAIDIGYTTETEEEKLELDKFVQKYLKPKKSAAESDKVVISSASVTPPEVSMKIKMKARDFEKLESIFQSKYSCRLNGPKSYLYCSGLLIFADVMIREGFEIRFPALARKHEPLARTLLEVEFTDNHYKYRKEIVEKGGYISAIMLRPLEVDNTDKLIADYEFMARTLRNFALKLVKENQLAYKIK